jgi:hypothetical protein
LRNFSETGPPSLGEGDGGSGALRDPPPTPLPERRPDEAPDPDVTREEEPAAAGGIFFFPPAPPVVELDPLTVLLPPPAAVRLTPPTPLPCDPTEEMELRRLLTPALGLGGPPVALEEEAVVEVVLEMELLRAGGTSRLLWMGDESKVRAEVKADGGVADLLIGESLLAGAWWTTKLSSSSSSL